MGALSATSSHNAIAQTPFGEVDRTASAHISFSAAERGQPVEAGSEVTVSGEGFKAGQEVTLFYGSTPLNSPALVADAEGKISAAIAIPASAVSGTHPIVVVAKQPYHAAIAELKVSPTVPLSGQDNYTITHTEVTRGLYQAAYSAKNNVLYTTSAVGRPPIRESEILKLNADTLAVLARGTPAEVAAPEGEQAGSAGVYGVYGLGLDDTKGTLWVTNTRQNTVAVYDQADLSLVKQFPAGTVNHARDVVIDEQLGKAYASAATTPDIIVFDTTSLEPIGKITIPALARGSQFSTFSLSFDPAAQRLYTVSMTTNEVAIIDTRTDAVAKVFPVPGAKSAIGVTHDAQTGRIYVVAQGSDNLIVLDGESGAVIADTPIGAGALNAAFDPLNRVVYVASRNAGTITVADADGKIIANLGPAPLANHVALGKDGVVYAVDKSANAREADNDLIMRIAPRR